MTGEYFGDFGPAEPEQFGNPCFNVASPCLRGEMFPGFD